MLASSFSSASQHLHVTRGETACTDAHASTHAGTRSAQQQPHTRALHTHRARRESCACIPRRLSRFVRFNIQQALLLDIVLIIPSFFSGLARSVPPDLAVMSSNFVFYFWVLVVGYSWLNIAQGKTPNEVPLLSEAAEIQIGPL